MNVASSRRYTAPSDEVADLERYEAEALQIIVKNALQDSEQKAVN
jgi:hypothetical protein